MFNRYGSSTSYVTHGIERHGEREYVELRGVGCYFRLYFILSSDLSLSGKIYSIILLYAVRVVRDGHRFEATKILIAKGLCCQRFMNK